jgi:hypothetical protein
LPASAQAQFESESNKSQFRRNPESEATLADENCPEIDNVDRGVISTPDMERDKAQNRPKRNGQRMAVG